MTTITHDTTITHEALRRAAASYAHAFGHPVPDTVIAMFSAHPGALVAEIQQAVRLTKPVPGWREHERRSPGVAGVGRTFA